MNLTTFLDREQLLDKVIDAVHTHGGETLAQRVLDTCDRATVQHTRAQSLGGLWRNHSLVLRVTALDISPEARRDIILHEVAHLVDCAERGRGYLRGEEDHGDSWRGWARALGAEPVPYFADQRFRDAANKLARSKRKLVLSCPECDKKWHRQRRPPRRKEYQCPDCAVRLIRH